MRIQELEEAKHIFSHIEWQMAGYVIKVAQLEGGRFGIAVFRGRGLHSELSGPICI